MKQDPDSPDLDSPEAWRERERGWTTVAAFIFAIAFVGLLTFLIVR